MDTLLLGLFVLLFGIYLRGWRGIHRRGFGGATPWRLAAMTLALGALGGALLPPLRAYETRSFFLHMVQHELLIEVAPLFFWLAAPYPFFLATLSRPQRQRWRSRLRHIAHHPRWRTLIKPHVIVPFYLTVVTWWHIPPVYDAIANKSGLHLLEHLSLLGAATLFWWHITNASPRLMPARTRTLPLLMLIAAYVHNELLGIGLVILHKPVYRFYASADLPWGLSPLADQALGGAMMWIPGELIYATTLMVTLARLLDDGEPFHGTFESYPRQKQRR